MSDISYAQVIEAKDGCEKTINHILESTRPLCYALISKMRVHRNDIDDVAQDAVVITLNCIGRFNPQRGSFETLVTESLKNMLRDRFGSMKRRRAQGLDTAPEPRVHGEERAVEARDILRSLPPSQRVLVREHYGIDGPEYSLNQLAARHGMSNDCVKQELQEAFNSMRKST